MNGIAPIVRSNTIVSTKCNPYDIHFSGVFTVTEDIMTNVLSMLRPPVKRAPWKQMISRGSLISLIACLASFPA